MNKQDSIFTLDFYKKQSCSDDKNKVNKLNLHLSD